MSAASQFRAAIYLLLAVVALVVHADPAYIIGAVILSRLEAVADPRLTIHSASPDPKRPLLCRLGLHKWGLVSGSYERCERRGCTADRDVRHA